MLRRSEDKYLNKTGVTHFALHWDHRQTGIATLARTGLNQLSTRIIKTYALDVFEIQKGKFSFYLFPPSLSRTKQVCLLVHRVCFLYLTPDVTTNRILSF